MKNKITEYDTLPSLLTEIETKANDHVYLLATYTAMLSMRELLAEKGYVTKEMK